MKYFSAIFSAQLFLPSVAVAATLTLGGASSATVGSTISIPVLLATNESANAASATINYPSTLLSLVSISKANSIFSLWPEEPTVSASRGQFEGVILNPGWSGQNGLLATMIFQVKAVGTATLSFAEGSVLANDGKGTELLTGTTPKTITISASAPPPVIIPKSQAVKITSSTHPDQNKTYATSTVDLEWNLLPGATLVQIGYDRFPEGVPTVTYDPPIQHKRITLGDGLWYFHVRQKDAAGWSAVATYRIHIDQSAIPSQSDTASSSLPLAATSSPLATVEPWTPFLVPLMLLPVAALLFLAGWLLGRRSRAGSASRVLIHQQFSQLKQALLEEMLALEKAKTQRALSVEEEHFMKRFKKMLDSAEKMIETSIRS